MDADQILAFRLARSGLARRGRGDPAAAAACPASDFARGSALLALAARVEGVTRERYDAAIEGGDLIVAHVVRGAIHALAPGDFALWGRALLARDDDELALQMGNQVRRIVADEGITAGEALTEVADATTEALANGRRLTKDELHEELRAHVRTELMPWCKGCGSHHVAPMLWRYATVRAGARLDARRRYRSGRPGRAPAARDAVRRFLHFHGPATPGELADWGGLATPHARRLWDEVADDLVEVRTGRRTAWLLAADEADLDAPPEAEGVRLLPPGDPYLQKPNRPLLVPDEALRKRLFRPVASPGAVLAGGRLAGLWRVTVKGARATVTIERTGRVRKGDLEEEARRVADLRGAEDLEVVLG